MKARIRELLMELKRDILNQDKVVKNHTDDCECDYHYNEFFAVSHHHVELINEIIFEMDKEDRNKNKNNENNC